MFGGNASNPIVDLGYAQYRGSATDLLPLEVTAFNGIYYAAAPTGELRWQPPVDIEKRNNYNASSVIEALVHGPQCVQGLPGWQEAELGLSPKVIQPAGFEDCLLLDVLVPTKPVSRALPVMVQIHGQSLLALLSLL